MKTHDKQSKATESIQPKAKNQSSVSTILSGYNNAIQRQAVEEEPLQGKFETSQLAAVEEEEPLQGKFDGIIQRHAYWAVDGNNKVNGNNTPTAVAPGGNYIKRAGASINHRLYDRSTQAKNAARKTTAWGDKGLSTRNPTTPDAGAGYYQYNQTVAKTGDNYNVGADAAMVVRHDNDPDAQLYSSAAPAVAISRVPHWHAATSNAADIKSPDSTAAQPAYNTIDIEHFYVNPL